MHNHLSQLDQHREQGRLDRRGVACGTAKATAAVTGTCRKVMEFGKGDRRCSGRLNGIDVHEANRT